MDNWFLGVTAICAGVIVNMFLSLVIGVPNLLSCTVAISVAWAYIYHAKEWY